MAKMTATKKVTKNQYETALAAFVNLETRIDTLVLGREKALNPILEKYDPQIQELKLLQDEQAVIVKDYVEANRGNLLTEGTKSYEHMGAHVGYKQNPEKVMILEGYEEKKIVDQIVREKDTKKGKKWFGFLRQTFALDKTKIKKEMPEGMEAIGLTVGSEETFFVEVAK